MCNRLRVRTEVSLVGPVIVVLAVVVFLVWGIWFAIADAHNRHQETFRLIATGEAEIKPKVLDENGEVVEWQLVYREGTK